MKHAYAFRDGLRIGSLIVLLSVVGLNNAHAGRKAKHGNRGPNFHPGLPKPVFPKRTPIDDLSEKSSLDANSDSNIEDAVPSNPPPSPEQKADSSDNPPQEFGSFFRAISDGAKDYFTGFPELGKKAMADRLARILDVVDISRLTGLAIEAQIDTSAPKETKEEVPAPPQIVSLSTLVFSFPGEHHKEWRTLRFVHGGKARKLVENREPDISFELNSPKIGSGKKADWVIRLSSQFRSRFTKEGTPADVPFLQVKNALLQFVRMDAKGKAFSRTEEGKRLIYAWTTLVASAAVSKFELTESEIQDLTQLNTEARARLRKLARRPSPRTARQKKYFVEDSMRTYLADSDLNDDAGDSDLDDSNSLNSNAFSSPGQNVDNSVDLPPLTLESDGPQLTQEDGWESTPSVDAGGGDEWEVLSQPNGDTPYRDAVLFGF